MLTFLTNLSIIVLIIEEEGKKYFVIQSAPALSYIVIVYIDSSLLGIKFLEWDGRVGRVVPSYIFHIIFSRLILLLNDRRRRERLELLHNVVAPSTDSAHEYAQRYPRIQILL
ncbi:Hypothetical protein FKW44_005468 [Caligus rogercresseyi]|uniref:Uncharacterized protein n=1 Tax=Caligus rogercresseyi TaxID=217165 RepID=A0A7T8KBZ6_CALRO|nr:Hypothetical protein FKW44_005468 [Caligus rogercresseyi]